MLSNELDELCKKNRNGSHATQANRADMLQLFVKQLGLMGFDTKECVQLKLKVDM
jgi:hypothetical protein